MGGREEKNEGVGERGGRKGDEEGQRGKGREGEEGGGR